MGRFINEKRFLKGMYSLKELESKMPVYLDQRVKIDPAILAEQLNLNGWLDEQLVEQLLGKSKKCVITVFATDYGVEAVVKGESAKDKDEQSTFPGFYVAAKASDLTIPKELERATAYISRKYTPKLGRFKIAPESFRIARVEPDVKNKQALVDIISEKLPFSTEQEYWDNYVTPELTIRYDCGRAMRVLDEAFEHHYASARIPHDKTEKWARGMMHSSLYSFVEMMKQHGRQNNKVMQYKTSQGFFNISNLDFCVFYNPEVEKQVIAGKRQVKVPVSFIVKAEEQ